MFATSVYRYLRVRNAPISRASLLPRRQFSVVSTTHTTFPATLYRFQTQRSSRLSDYKESGDSEDGVELSEDGLVRPRVSGRLPFSNGASLMPNTFTMQEWVRTNYDYYVDSLEDGQSTSDAMVLSVPKGTAIPRSLTLLSVDLSRFSLQPAHPTRIKELNDLLSEFYDQNATFINAEEWMEQNEYHNSFSDDDTEKWGRE